MGLHRNRKPKADDIARALDALAVLRAGGTHADVVAAGIYRSPSSSRNAVKRLLDRRRAADIDEHRQVVGEQLSALWSKAWEALQAGDLSVIGPAVRVLE